MGLSTAIEGYLLATGEFRYGANYVSKLFGYNPSYILRTIKNRSKKLKDLLQRGFTGDLVTLSVKRDGRGSIRPKSISFNDFCLLVEYEAVKIQNKKAIGLLTASFRELLLSRTQEAFGLPQESFEQKLVKFDVNYQYYKEDQEELLDLQLYGDAELIYLESWHERLERLYSL